MMAADKTVAPDRSVLDWPVIFVLAIVHVGALAALPPGAFSWPAIVVAILLHWLTGGVGITLGYHRLITHRSFEIPKRWEYALLLCGMLACRMPLEWVAKHRRHSGRSSALGPSTHATARLEGLNGLFQAARSRARGYRNIATFITMIYLIAAPIGNLFNSI